MLFVSEGIDGSTPALVVKSQRLVYHQPRHFLLHRGLNKVICHPTCYLDDQSNLDLVQLQCPRQILTREHQIAISIIVMYLTTLSHERGIRHHVIHCADSPDFL